MGRYQRVWLVPWEPGQIGIGYATSDGEHGFREFRWNDPEAWQLYSALNDRDRIKLQEHFDKVTPLRKSRTSWHWGRRA